MLSIQLILVKNYQNEVIICTFADSPSDTLGQPGILQIYIEATIGRGYAGDTAIDDLLITDSPCGK